VPEFKPQYHQKKKKEKEKVGEKCQQNEAIPNYIKIKNIR
jgi:ribosomal protein L39E